MQQTLVHKILSETLILRPLEPSDFEALHSAASDPLIWEQHPDRLRYTKPVFQKYFDSGIRERERGGCTHIILIANQENPSGKVIGSSRFYDFQPDLGVVKIGYTFITRDQWGKGTNPVVKGLMLKRAFQYVDRVHFEVGSRNIRSQIAIKRLGAREIDRIEIVEPGIFNDVHVIFELQKSQFDHGNFLPIDF